MSDWFDTFVIEIVNLSILIDKLTISIMDASNQSDIVFS